MVWMRSARRTALLLVAVFGALAVACSDGAAPDVEPTTSAERGGIAVSPAATLDVDAGTTTPGVELLVYTPTTTPPAVDTSISSVPISEVLFDTFRGGYIPLSEAPAQAIDQLRDALRPIYEPVYDGAEGGGLAE
jgi:hypothetical protein